MGILACTVGITALAVGGANHLDAFAVKADPTGYSVTFDESNTTVEAVGTDYAICTTTAAGNKVSVTGSNSTKDAITFKGFSFKELYLWTSSSILENVGANDFDHITGFAISFSGEGTMIFFSGTTPNPVTSGTPYTGLSITPANHPVFSAGGKVTISSLTIYYSC